MTKLPLDDVMNGRDRWPTTVWSVSKLLLCDVMNGRDRRSDECVTKVSFFMVPSCTAGRDCRQARVGVWSVDRALWTDTDTCLPVGATRPTFRHRASPAIKAS